jgi:hypothetical protein
MIDLNRELSMAQNAVLLAYKTYNEPIAKVAAVEWVKELWRLNKETNNNLLDFLTTAESMYTEIANNLNVESQYQQQ